ncbi:hypothetical protein WICMUC_003979 [Wickerhamomyces mucosus]|uniref:Uncharacterized protein n=1 Tax=Wickerhamomyces mucosus TaxID=1378264 RepID=A0A9P8PJY8_9ASCO|nr:hypothetical protein WICMUC_003979 [Wickerhamomyces mucosus]
MTNLNAKELVEIKNKYYDTLIDELNNGSKPKLKELEDWKSSFIETLAKRYNEDNDIYINKDELIKIIEFKLKKGKFRPTLRKLVLQNEESIIISTINEAFNYFVLQLNKKDTKIDEENYLLIVKHSLEILIKLRGVGPATASLLLSFLSGITSKSPPFFSDEAAIEIFKKEDSNYKLKYNVKEYLHFIEYFFEIDSKFEFGFDNLESGLWCIGIGLPESINDNINSNNNDEHDQSKSKDRKLKLKNGDDDDNDDDDESGKSIKKRRLRS